MIKDAMTQVAIALLTPVLVYVSLNLVSYFLLAFIVRLLAGFYMNMGNTALYVFAGVFFFAALITFMQYPKDSRDEEDDSDISSD